MDIGGLTGLRCLLANSPDLWQFNLLDPQGLCHFAKDRGISFFSGDRIGDLWRIGLLRADLVVGEQGGAELSLKEIANDTHSTLYCDDREVEHRTASYGGSLSDTHNDPAHVQLLFHPFRLYVLYHIERAFRFNPSATQYLQYPQGLVNLADTHVEVLARVTSEKRFADRCEYWNRTAELAIVSEPATYEAVFASTKRNEAATNQDTLQRELDCHREELKRFLLQISVSRIDESRAELCRNAELLDQNKLMHVLLRLMSSHERHKLRGALGACMLFLCMSEIIRRAAEEALCLELPEEDEMGFGQWMEGARQTIYGTKRILDATPETQRDFLTSMGLDHGVKVRCYVEGETEYGAFVSAVGHAGGIEFINLQGNVLEKHGKGLSFASALENDKQSHVFSVVVLDQDRDDHVRALKKAAREGRFFGRFFISTPDFEFGNFTLTELVDVICKLASQAGEGTPSRDNILQIVNQARSGKEFFAKLSRGGIQSIGKGEAWGVALMNLALESPELPPDHENSGKRRGIVEVAELLLSGRRAGYVRSLD